jgi:cytochrome oxidase assembly protein ShyY1
MASVFEIYLVEKGDSILVARGYTPEEMLEAVKELLNYLMIWDGAREGLQIKVNVYEVPEEGEAAHEA